VARGRYRARIVDRTVSSPTAASLLPDHPTGALLLDAAAGLAGTHDLLRLTEIVRRAARALVGADGVTFVLREGDRVHYADEDAIAPLWKGRRFPADSCISGWVMNRGTPAVIEDVFADDRIPHDVYRPTFVKSLAMVPVRPPEPVAAIGAYWATRRRATAHEVRLLEALAGLASTALANLALEAELRQALAARDELLGIASHELRTPIAALRLQVDRGLSLAPAGAQRTWLERMGRSVARLDRLVTSLLDVSRIHLGAFQLDPEDLDLCTLAIEVAGGFRESQRAEVRLAAEGPVRGRWDRDRVAQILENLLSNAVKFGAGKPIEVRVTRDGAFARVSVTDHGIGIAPEHHARIFDRFGRAVSDRHYGGFGLGLWIARHCAEAHGGTLEVASRPGEGATFSFTLPLKA